MDQEIENIWSILQPHGQEMADKVCAILYANKNGDKAIAQPSGKAQCAREYRDKRLAVAVQIMAVNTGESCATWLSWADDLIRANEEMAVPE